MISSPMAQLKSALICESTRLPMTGASWAIAARSARTSALLISESRLPFHSGKT
jgi:hypothetical protein